LWPAWTVRKGRRIQPSVNPAIAARRTAIGLGLEITVPAIRSRSSTAAVYRPDIITAIPGQSLIEKLLAHLRLQALPPPCAPAHGPHMYAA
jgi:hypothetical protein